MEKPDPNLIKEWNRKLKSKESPAKLDKQKIPINPKTKDFIHSTSTPEESDILIEAMQDILEEYALLPEKIQQDIINDIENQKQTGAKFKTISDRLHLLVQRGTELVATSVEDSDKHYKPKLSLEEIKLKKDLDKENEIIAENVDELLEKLERIKQDGIENQKSQDSFDNQKSSVPSKDWIH